MTNASAAQSSSAAVAPAAAPPTALTRRQQRNREAARVFRDRKRAHVACLETKAAHADVVESENAELKAQIAALLAQNAGVQAQLDEFKNAHAVEKIKNAQLLEDSAQMHALLAQLQPPHAPGAMQSRYLPESFGVNPRELSVVPTPEFDEIFLEFVNEA